MPSLQPVKQQNNFPAGGEFKSLPGYDKDFMLISKGINSMIYLLTTTTGPGPGNTGGPSHFWVIRKELHCI